MKHARHFLLMVATLLCSVSVNAQALTDVSQLSNSKLYFVSQPGHASGTPTSWIVPDGGDVMTVNNQLGVGSNKADVCQQFAFISNDGGTTRYLYHPAEQKFVNKDGSLGELPMDAVYFMAGNQDGTFVVYFDASHVINTNDNDGLIINRWGPLSGWGMADAGNSCVITMVGGFDPTEALVMFAAAEEEKLKIIEFKAGANGWIEGTEWYSQADNIVEFTSPLYRFRDKVETLRITVNHTKGNTKYFCLSELEFYNATGNKIVLDASNVASNADHNALNPNNPDGGGFAALFDGETSTYFHSAWLNMPAGEHYLEVTLPNGGYDAFSFKMLSRSRGNGYDQSHTFPGEMVMATTVALESAGDDEPAGLVTTLSAADPTKCYTVVTNGRGAWAVDADGSIFSSTSTEGLNIDAADARQQFAILSANGEDYYLYSVSAKKFVAKDASLVPFVGDAIALADASSIETGRVQMRFKDIEKGYINLNGNGVMTIDGWSTIDDGNAVVIAEAGDFDAAEALAILANPEGARKTYLIARAQELLAANTDNHAERPALGQYGTGAYENLAAIVVSDTATATSVEHYIAAFEASKCLPVFTIDGVNDYAAGMSIYDDGGQYLRWKATDSSDETMLWAFDMTETTVGVADKVVIKNLATGNLFMETGYGVSYIRIAETSENIADDGLFLMFREEDTGYAIWASHSGIIIPSQGIFSANSTSAWKFTYVGTTYSINEPPAEPDAPDTPVVPDSAVAASLPLKYMAGENGWIEGTEWLDEEMGFVGYASPLYVFGEKVETFRIIVKRTQSGDKFFSLSELGFFDAEGNKIELTEANVTSNADHNTLNPGRPDGGGIAALFDEDVNTYFHSAWQNIPQGDHYLEVTLPNGGYDAFSFEMISRGGQTRIFPGEMVITDAFQYELLDALYGSTGDINLHPFPEVGYYYDDLSYIEEALSKTYELLVNNGSEAECEAMVAELTQALERYRSMDVCLPNPDKGYRVISAFPGFAEHQLVEKAITINPESNALWWEDVCDDNEMQEFIFEPVLDESGQHLSWVMDINYNGSVVTEKQYFYNMKNAATGLYVNYSPGVNFHLVNQPCTVYLAPLGGGQFGIRFRIANEYGGGTIYTMHAGDHNEGYPSDSIGDYGGTFGMSSGIVNWYGEDHTASAWFIRETHELPYTMPVAEDKLKFKSGFVNFEATDVITLTADKECSFANLGVYSSYGFGHGSSWNEEIEIAKCEVSGNTATITLDRKVTSCAFSFDNYEGVSSVTFDATSSVVEDPSLQLVGVTPDSETSQAWVRALTLSFNKEVYVWSLDFDVRGMNTGEEFYINSHHIGENSDGGFDLTLYLGDANDGWTKMITVPDTYTYTIPAGAIKSVDGEDLPETTVTFTVDGTFSVANYSPAETTSLEQIELTFDKVIEEMNIYYGWDVYNEEGDAVAYIDWGSGRGSKTVTLGLNTPITTPGKYYFHIFADAFSAENDMPNMPADLTFTVVEDTPEVSTDYVMKAQDVKGRASSVVNLPIEMDNETAVTAFQFDLYLPEGVSVATIMEDDEAIYDITFNKERSKSSHVIAVEPQDDGSLRVAGYSTSNVPFVGNSGVLVNVMLTVADVDEGSYPIVLRNIRIVTDDDGGNATEKLSVDCTATLTVENTLLGDVNSDGHFTMIDVVMMVNAVLEKEQTNFNANAADLNGDGQITMVDVVGVLRLVLTDHSAMAPARSASRSAVAMPELSVCELVALGNNRVVLPVALDNAEAYSAFQLDVVLPEGVVLEEAALTRRAEASHAVAWNTLSNGRVRIVAYAMDNVAFRGNEGALLNLVLSTSGLSGEEVVAFGGGLFATVDGAEHRAADVSVVMRSETTGIDEAHAAAFHVYGVEEAVEVVCNADTVVSIYATTGQLVEQTVVKAGKNVIALPTGMYVINGNKVIVK